MWMKRFLAGSVALALVVTGSLAAAAPKEEKKNDQAMEFNDDPLEAGGLGPNDVGIKVRSGPVRSTLIKPRMTFIPQMLKSVQNL